MIPPTRDIGDSLVLYREPEGEVFGLILENQDSYESFPEEIELYLKLLGIVEELGVLNYVWNFGGARLFLTTMQYEPLSVEQAKAFGKKEMGVTF